MAGFISNNSLNLPPNPMARLNRKLVIPGVNDAGEWNVNQLPSVTAPYIAGNAPLDFTKAREVVAGNGSLPIVNAESPLKGNLSQAQIDSFWNGVNDEKPVTQKTNVSNEVQLPDILKNYDLQKEALETAYKENPAIPFPEYRHPELPKVVDISGYRFNPRSFGGQLEAMSPGLATLDNPVARVIAGAGQGFTNRRLGALEQALKEGELARQHTQDVNANAGIENEFTKAKYDYDVGVRNEVLARAMRSAGYPLDVIKATVEGLDKQADIDLKKAQAWHYRNPTQPRPVSDVNQRRVLLMATADDEDRAARQAAQDMDEETAKQHRANAEYYRSEARKLYGIEAPTNQTNPTGGKPSGLPAIVIPERK